MSITEQDILDAKRISEIFSELSEEKKLMIIGYISALRDKETADKKSK